MTCLFKYIYGPVPSWRLGSSLGIDLLSQEEKICDFDCLYCQLGPTKKHTLERKSYVSRAQVLDELAVLSVGTVEHITFSGRGEPTLAANLGEVIKEVKMIRKEPVAVLTNSSLLGIDMVREELASADFVVAKLDASSAESLQEINRPAKEVKFESIIEGIKSFRGKYKGKLALQMMFIEKNKNDVNKFVPLINYIKPDEIQVNTPLRHSDVKPLESGEIGRIKDQLTFSCKGMDIVSVYDQKFLKAVASVSDEDTLRRRGKIK